MSDENLYLRAYEREKKARQEAEAILENTSRKLYLTNQQLEQQNKELKARGDETDLFLSIAQFAQHEFHLKTAMRFFLKSICTLCGWPVGHVYVPSDSKAKELTSLGVWYCADKKKFHPFQEKTRKINFQAGYGLPGRILLSGNSLWITDIPSDANQSSSNFPRAAEAQKAGIKSAFGVPIKCNSKIIAIAEFFSDHAHETDDKFLSLVNSAALQLGKLLERRTAQDELKESYKQLKEYKSELEHLARYDSLTNLPNRLQFEIILKREIAKAQRHNHMFALLMIDLDNFKAVNDTLGHDVGDLLLKEVSHRLQKGLRAEDFVARLGGDEFAAILSEITDYHKPGLIAQKIKALMKKPFHVRGYEIPISASIGISCYPEGGEETISLTKNADIALYLAKAEGRDTHRYFTEDLDLKYQERMRIEKNIRAALKKEEFYLAYQPKIDLVTQKVVGAEALLRWQLDGKTVFPDIFIPIAEESGLIIKIGEWALREACQQFMRFPSYFQKNCTLSVNLSPRQLSYKSLYKSVQEVLKDTGMPPSRLELELTETALMLHFQDTEKLLNKLSSFGLEIAIDDFGTGYSSLSRLKDLPINTLKIDKTFIQDIGIIPDTHSIIKSIIVLGKNLGLNVVAEGVETNEQLQFLIDNHCPQVQGYYFCKPVCADDFIEFIKASNGVLSPE
ncbi:MAG: diguanylate cyclase domain [Alphaproteobacteria bacterium]|nr:diguanylate cyclase domain [Alphaproteobacteria bacterium]